MPAPVEQWHIKVIMPKSAADGLRALHRAMGEALGTAFMEGYRAGHALLLGLARGEVSEKEFDGLVQESRQGE